jgi:putative transposase
MAGILAYRPDGSRARVLFHVRPGAYNDEALIEVLRHLRRHLRGPVTLVWDGLPSHRSNLMRAFLQDQRSWLRVQPLPAYAPDLNPVEGLWANLKGAELANFCADTTGECIDAARKGVERVRGDAALAFAFLRQTGLLL